MGANAGPTDCSCRLKEPGVLRRVLNRVTPLNVTQGPLDSPKPCPGPRSIDDGALQFQAHLCFGATCGFGGGGVGSKVKHQSKEMLFHGGGGGGGELFHSHAIFFIGPAQLNNLRCERRTIIACVITSSEDGSVGANIDCGP